MKPLNYKIHLEPNLETFIFAGRTEIEIDSEKSVDKVVLNANDLNFRSCKVKTVDVDGAEITTLEGLCQNNKLHPIQEAFMETGAIQCGYCTPAQILSAKALLDRNPDHPHPQPSLPLDARCGICSPMGRPVDEPAAVDLASTGLGLLLHSLYGSDDP